MQAAHQRRLRPGSEYTRYFPLQGLEKSDPILANGDTYETIRQMDKWIRRYQSDTVALAPVLRGATLLATCRNVWEFAYRHFQYKLDEDGVEQLRRPLRSWADRRAGIDCDCYAILISSILLNLRIPHTLRKTKYQNKPDFQHIYVIVPVPGSSRYLTLDPVLDEFDKEAPYTGKHDHPMDIQGLNGIASESPSAVRLAVRGAVPVAATTLSGASGGARLPFGTEFMPLQQRVLGLAGLGRPADDAALPTVAPLNAATVGELATALNSTPAEAVAYATTVAAISAEVLMALRIHLTNTRQQVLANKESSLYPLAETIDKVLAVWDDAPARDALISAFAATGTLSPEMARDSIIDAEYLDLHPGILANSAPQLAGPFDFVGDFFSNVGHAVGQAGSWVGQQVKTGAQGVAQAGTWVGNGVAQGASATWSGVKQATNWVVQQAVKIGKVVIKYNPLAVVIRLGLRVAMRVNLFYMAERLAIGYASEQEAVAAGMNLAEFRTVKERLSKTISLYNGLQGDENELKEAVLSGNRNASNPTRLPSLQGLSELQGLGEPVTATTTAAASGFIATIVSWLKGVNWTKLFTTAAAVAPVVQSLVDKYTKVPVPGQSAQMPLTDAEYYANRPKYDNPPTDSSNLPLILGGVGLLAAYIILK